MISKLENESEEFTLFIEKVHSQNRLLITNMTNQLGEFEKKIEKRTKDKDKENIEIKELIEELKSYIANNSNMLNNNNLFSKI